MRSRPLLLLLFLLAAPLELSAQELKEVATLRGHKQWVSGVALSADGKLLAAGSGEKPGALKVWDVPSGQEVASFDGHVGRVEALAFRADGKWLVAGDNHSVRNKYAIKVWDVAAKKEVAAFPLPEYPRAVGISPGGQRVAAAGTQEVRLWEVADGKEVASFRQLVYAWLPAFSGSLKTLASPNYQEIDLWDLAAAKERLVLSEHRGSVSSVAFSADDRLLASASTYTTEERTRGGQVKVWDAVSGRERATLQGEFGYVYALALRADGKQLALLHWHPSVPDADTEFRLLDVATSRVLLTHKGQRRSLAGVWFTRDGRLFVAERLPDHAVRLWEAVAAKE